ncbi:MAG TPA: LPS assembly protein LptD, partial [Lacunisphaera sp.]
MSFVRHLPALLGTWCLLAGLAHAQPEVPHEFQVTGDRTVYDDTTKETVLTGHGRLVNGDTIITADTLRYNTATTIVTASGHLVLTTGKRRLVGDEGTYNLTTRELNVRNLRVGEFPIYVSGDTVSGTIDELVFTNATVFFRENASYTPSVHAEHLTYARGKIVKADGLRLGLLGGHFISLPHFEQKLGVDFVSFISAHVGYRGNLGVFAQLGLHVPVAPGVQAGADVGLYSLRGLMVGPSGSYNVATEDGAVRGAFHSGYISDSGDRKTDVLGRPVPRDRSFFEWQHRQKNGDHFTLDGEFNYWSDSEVLRDFQHKDFDQVQQPDSFLEAAYTENNYAFSAFARVNPNHYFRVQERLPEIRFDLMPSSLGGGIYERGSASVAVLQSDAFSAAPDLRTNRFDAYYGLERPIAPTPWFTFTPVAGARVTHYTNALGGKSDYTRTLGELGFDANLLASGTFNYKNEVWEIDGLRHLVEPKVSYRYAPETERGKAYIPPIDSRVFSTYLQPLSIGDSRSIDDLSPLNTLRLSLDNIFQTRDKSYGSRDLASLNFAADYRFDHPGTAPLSDIYTTFALTPAPWLRWEVFHRFDPHGGRMPELNTALDLIDQEWWTVRLATHYLRDNYEEYDLEWRQRLNEVFDATALWRYDARNRRLNEQSYGVWQRLGQTWAIKYEVSWFNGPRRESHFALNVEVEL